MYMTYNTVHVHVYFKTRKILSSYHEPCCNEVMLVSLSQLISGFENGLLGTRISKEYQKLFKRDPPLNLLELAGKMPFVTMEE